MSSILQVLAQQLLLTTIFLLICSEASGWKPTHDSFALLPRCSDPTLLPSFPVLMSLRGGDIQYPDNIVVLDEIVEEAKNNNQLIVIDFYEDNCAPCEKVAPLYQELSDSEEFAGKVLFLKVKVSDHPIIANQYSVTGWPTFVFIKNGQVQTEIVGGKLAEATLYDWIKLLMPKEEEAEAETEEPEQEEPVEQDVKDEVEK